MFAVLVCVCVLVARFVNLLCCFICCSVNTFCFDVFVLLICCVVVIF